VCNDHLLKMLVSLMAIGAAADSGGAGGYLSLTTAVFIAPYLLFSGYAGHVADVFNKRSVLIVTKAGEVAIMGLALVGLMAARFDWMMVILFLMAVQSAFFSPAKYGILPEMLPQAQLSRGNGLLELCRFGGVLLGTASAGLLLLFASDRPMMIGMVLVALAAVGTLMSFAIGSGRDHSAPKHFRSNPWAEIITGVRRLAGDGRLGAVVMGITFFEFLGSFVMLDLLLVGKEVMRLSDTSVSLLLAFAGLGIGFGSILAGRLSGERIELGLVPIGAAGVALGLTISAFAAGSFGWMAAVMAFVGTFSGLFLVPLYALLQHRPGGHEKGLLISTNNFLNMLGVLLSCGMLWVLRDVCSISPDTILLLAGLFMAAATALVLRLKPGLGKATTSWLLSHRRFRKTMIG
jgi:MFS family permease